MSNYRDDVMETVFISDLTLVNIAGIAEDYLSVSDSQHAIIAVHLTDHARVQDELPDGFTGLSAYDSVRILDEAAGYRHAGANCFEQLKTVDRLTLRAVIESEDQLTASDAVQVKQRILLSEIARIEDSTHGQRLVQSSVYEQAKISDALTFCFFDESVGSITVSDRLVSRLQAFSQNTEELQIQASLLEQMLAVEKIFEQLSISDDAEGVLHAVSRCMDMTSAQDSVNFDSALSMAWIANTDTWAMSRYAPYGFRGASVINGKLYLWNEQGVYQSGIEGELISAKLNTGKLDFGDALTHPIGAYLEYRLDGGSKQLEMSVTTTQSGSAKKYTYLLPHKNAQQLTNGRIVFGRGLRGRHFSFDVSIQAASAQIYAWSIEHQQTARRT